MLLFIAIILLVLWGLGLALHVLGGFIYMFLVAALLVGLAHFVKGNKTSNL
ncbi:MAG: DUF5670 family protein [Candidatus Doudnabacteria bacterium]|nr:DUF5670 family protein [Candidatus Doudnabacteria bacterium]